jgi:hypothetical protein
MKGSQRALFCACGRDNILAHGLCPTCYTLKRRDASYFGGLREEVLKRDGYSCRGCGAPGPIQALDYSASPSTRRVSTFSHDLLVPEMPCQGGAHPNGAF